MIAPVHRLKKDQIIWLANHKCKHGHTYLEHYNCYLKEWPSQPLVGFFDIENSWANFKADACIMLSYAIKVQGKDIVLGRGITREELLSKDEDRQLVRECVADFSKFDLIYGFYSTKHDVPFLRTRAIIHNIPFPKYGTIKHKDIWYTLRSKFKFTSNRLDWACEQILGASRKTKGSPEIWRRAQQGNQKALDYIADHNVRDVEELEKLTDKVIEYMYPINRSI